MQQAPGQALTVSYSGAFANRVGKSLRRFNPWASARALNPAGTPRPRRSTAITRTALLLPASQLAFLNLPLEERRRARACVPRQQPFSTELGGRCRKAPYRTATSTQSCIHRRNPQASGGRAPLKRRLTRPETAVRFEASGKCSLGYNPVA